MNRNFNLLLLSMLVFFTTTAFGQNLTENPTLTTFILVRHAEKGNDGTDDPDLKPEGHDRAKRLVALLSNVALDGVYSTPFKRTKNTVTPAAESRGLEVKVYESLKPEVVDKWISDHAGKTILIAGHSNTIPQLANMLLGQEVYKNFPDSEYGNVLVVTVVKRGSGKVLGLSY